MLVSLWLALGLDLAFGEPPNRWHPVAWMGWLLDQGQAWAPTRGRLRLLLYGALLLLGVLSLVVIPVTLPSRGLLAWGWGGVIVEAVLLKLTFSVRALFGAARSIQRALAQGNLNEARRLTGWHLVSRPTQELSSAQVVSATVESVAENLTDSFVAPLFFYVVFGLPGAWAYRVINTADSMLGYREGALEYFGKASARLDDLVNWIPARLAAIGIVLGAFFVGGSASGAWRVMWRDHGLTRSPNAGWTMAAMAGALSLTLEKPGAYRLGGSGAPAVEAIPRALRVAGAAIALAITASLAAMTLWS